MKVTEIVELLQGSVITGENITNQEVTVAFASDLMSDVLTIKTENLLLLTGLVNIQAIRTAEMSDIGCIVFVRDKVVPDEIKKLAQECHITIIISAFSLFRASGILFQAGIKPVF